MLGNQTVFNVLRQELVSPDRNVKLGGREAEILRLLFVYTNEVVSKEQIHEKVWGKVFVSDTSVTKAVSNLRKSLARFERLACEIKTVPKEGYVLVCESRAIFEPSYGKDLSLNIKCIDSEKKTLGQSKLILRSHVSNFKKKRENIQYFVTIRLSFLGLFFASLLGSFMTISILLLFRLVNLT